MAFAYSPTMADRYYTEYPFPGGGWFAVCLSGTEEPLGRAGLVLRGDLYEPPEIEMAYGLADQHRGNGYATEACKALFGYALKELGLPRLFAGVHINNLSSQRVAERIGLHYELTIDWYGEKHKMYWYRKTSDRSETLRGGGTQQSGGHVR